MTVLAIMQNQWFKDPARVAAIFSRHPSASFRRRFIKHSLFQGCKSGNVLMSVFGDMLDDWIFEEASPQVGGHSASSFPADLDHITTVIGDVKPDIIVTFGKTAREAIELIRVSVAVLGVTAMVPIPLVNWCHIAAPHPAARSADALQRLREAKREIEGIIATSSHQSQ
mgnify:CR=1 FL=1